MTGSGLATLSLKDTITFDEQCALRYLDLSSALSLVCAGAHSHPNISFRDCLVYDHSALGIRFVKQETQRKYFYLLDIGVGRNDCT